MAPSGGTDEKVLWLQAIPGLGVQPGKPLARLSTLRIGGPAELFVEVGSERALVALLQEVARRKQPFQLLGLGSNVLVPDAWLRARTTTRK